MKHEITQWKCFVQTHLLFVTIYGLMWSSSVTFKHKMTLCTPMYHRLRDITLSSNVVCIKLGLSPWSLFTGRNEVLAKVIFSEACVILSTGGMVWSRGSPILGGSSKFSGRGVFLQIFLGGGGVVPPNFWGVSKFSGGLQFLGGSSKFLGGLQFFRGGGSSKFSGGVLYWNTVTVQPVRILLECILVSLICLLSLITNGIYMCCNRVLPLTL